jgi:hypothetical protein
MEFWKEYVKIKGCRKKRIMKKYLKSSFIIRTHYQNKEDEISDACSMHKRDYKYVQRF